MLPGHGQQCLLESARPQVSCHDRIKGFLSSSGRVPRFGCRRDQPVHNSGTASHEGRAVDGIRERRRDRLATGRCQFRQWQLRRMDGERSLRRLDRVEVMGQRAVQVLECGKISGHVREEAVRSYARSPCARRAGGRGRPLAAACFSALFCRRSRRCSSTSTAPLTMSSFTRSPRVHPRRSSRKWPTAAPSARRTPPSATRKCCAASCVAVITIITS